MEFDVDLMIPDQSLSIDEGAIVVMGWQSCTDKGSYTRAILEALCKEYNFSLDTPFQDYPQEVKDILIHGTNGREVKVYYKGQGRSGQKPPEDGGVKPAITHQELRAYLVDGIVLRMPPPAQPPGSAALAVAEGQGVPDG